PDTLRRAEHGIAAVAFLVVAVGLVAVDDDLVTDLPPLHLVADRPDDAGRIRAGDVIGRLVHVEGRDRAAEPGPDAVVVDARGHHHDQHLVGIERGRRHHFDLHGLLGLAVALAADRPGIHLRRHMAERRDLADLVEVLRLLGPQRNDLRCLAHALLSPRGRSSDVPRYVARAGPLAIG